MLRECERGLAACLGELLTRLAVLEVPLGPEPGYGYGYDHDYGSSSIGGSARAAVSTLLRIMNDSGGRLKVLQGGGAGAGSGGGAGAAGGGRGGSGQAKGARALRHFVFDEA